MEKGQKNVEKDDEGERKGKGSYCWDRRKYKFDDLKKIGVLHPMISKSFYPSFAYNC